MKDVIDYAKYFMKNSADEFPDTEEGCEKLQNILALADMIHIAETGVPLFDEEVLAVEEGT